jgi:hypothetical protein
VRNHTNLGLISLFLESVKADFVCVAANSIRREFIENSPGIHREFAGNSPGLAVFSCVAGNLIHREKTQDF